VPINSSSVTLQWMPPETPNGIITQYSLQSSDMTLLDNLSGDVLMFTVGELSPLTMYILQLRAHTRVGEGPPTSMTVTTSELLKLLFSVYACVVCVWVQTRHKQSKFLTTMLVRITICSYMLSRSWVCFLELAMVDCKKDIS